MYPTLLSGDRVLICKRKLRHKLRVNSIVVFKHKVKVDDKESVDIYCKRIIGLPGDTLSIKNGYYHSTQNTQIGYLPAQTRFHVLGKHSDSNNSKSFPNDTIFAWNLYNFGPIYIPKQDETIILNTANFLLYRNIVQHETDKDFKLLENQNVAYQFVQNYYFIGGDNINNSFDSRHFGLIPETAFIGIPTHVLYSLSPISKVFIKNRVLKRQ